MKTVSLIYICLFLCLFDAVCTIYGHNKGIITELNPLMNYFMGKSYLAFFAVKMFLSAVACFILTVAYYVYEKKYIKNIIYVLIGIYLILAEYHVLILSL